MSIDVAWVNNDDMEHGVALIQKVGNEATIVAMDWDNVSSAISLLIAYRELRGAKSRVKELIEEQNMSYGGTK